MVIGAGSTAVSESLYLANLCKEVILMKRKNLHAEAVLLERLSKSNVDVRTGVISSINGDTTVKSVSVGNQIIPIDGVFVAIGHSPVSSVFKDLVGVDKSGYLLHQGVLTREPGVFVAGDVGEPSVHQAISAAGSGCRAAIAAAEYLQK